VNFAEDRRVTQQQYKAILPWPFFYSYLLPLARLVQPQSQSLPVSVLLVNSVGVCVCVGRHVRQFGLFSSPHSANAAMFSGEMGLVTILTGYEFRILH
jgi:hypothetical protein